MIMFERSKSQISQPISYAQKWRETVKKQNLQTSLGVMSTMAYVHQHHSLTLSINLVFLEISGINMCLAFIVGKIRLGFALLKRMIFKMIKSSRFKG